MKEKTKPNILIFFTDQMVENVTSPDSQCIMPNVERLSATGIRFSDTYCTTPHCCPSRASFQTGQYPSTHGVWNNVSNLCAINTDLNEGIPTLGEHLSDEGYNLFFAGKWHVSDKKAPSDYGWEEYNYNPKINNYGTSRIARFEQGKSPQKTKITKNMKIKRPGWINTAPYGTIGDQAEYELGYYNTIQKCSEKIKQNAEKDEPWCMVSSCNIPHDPYIVPEKYLRMYDDVDITLPPSFSDNLKDKPRIYQRMRYQTWDQLSEDDTKDCLKHYWALCTMMDAWFGILLDSLEESGQAENTIVIFTSDHGDYAAAHGLWCKGVPAFREGYRIPNIISWPKYIKNSGRTVDKLISNCDFMPTLVEAAGADTPDVYGKSLLPFLAGEEAKNWRDEIHFQMNGVELYYTQRTVMTKKWKYTYNGFDFDELYDLENDPCEMINLAFPDRYEGQKPKAQDNEEFIPYPWLPPELDKVRREMYRRIWKFAREQKDEMLYTPYITTSQACYGPTFAFNEPEDI
jgi:choline-sulfatase